MKQPKQLKSKGRPRVSAKPNLTRSPNSPPPTPTPQTKRRQPVDPSTPRIQELSRHSTKSFPIVGIGASAGGLEAFLDLLRDLPQDTGMGFVFVQHLDPTHGSALAALLARATAMQVREVASNMRVEPNCIYVIAPNVQMIIEGGVLRVTPRATDRGPPRSIDLFFQSLARDRREHGIGVVLSGTAMDGTLGLEAIKAEGGVTFAQDASAKYDSMPRSAIAAGCVDFVLSAQAIAAELATIALHPFVRTTRAEGPEESAALGDDLSPASGQPTNTPENEAAFSKVLLRLRNHCGVDFTHYKASTVRRRLARRLILNKQPTLASYVAFLKGNPKELDALYSDILINVTTFFRNPAAFEALKRKVIPKLLAQRGRAETLRIWVLGCSTGEEAYSLAMVFNEVAARQTGGVRLQVFATDLNEAVLEKARAGLYANSIAQDVSPTRLRRFFTLEQNGFRVTKALRAQVVFARQNVLTDPPFSRIDLVACRNLLIYLQPELQRKIIPAFHYALKPAGILFLGASESIGAFRELFASADSNHKIFSRKLAPTPVFRLPLPVDQAIREGDAADGSNLRSEDKPLARSNRDDLDIQLEADHLTAKSFGPPGVLVDAEGHILQFRGHTAAYLEHPSGKGTSELLKMAREGIMMPLRAAINEAKRKNRSAQRKGFRLRENGERCGVTIQVIPLRKAKDWYFLIFFADSNVPQTGRTLESFASLPTSKKGRLENSRRMRQLERELAETREYLRSIQEQNETSTEELQASHEEVQSTNEELQSMNEELETSKEELESSNEELITINDEMVSRNIELTRLNSDLSNLQVSLQTAILLLGRDLTVRRFTVPAERLFNLRQSDIGRGFGSLRHDLEVPDLERLLAEVVETVGVQERDVQDTAGHWYALRARPYLTLDSKIDGVVLMLTDIDALKRSEQSVKAARDEALATVKTMPMPYIILRGDLRVNSASDVFYRDFQVRPIETEGRLIYELGNGQWDIPALRTLLENILPHNRFFSGYEVSHDFPGLGRRTMLLNGCRLESVDGAGRSDRFGDRRGHIGANEDPRSTARE